jgi:hypothetical protein
MLHRFDRRERSERERERDGKVAAAAQARRERIEPLLRRRAARTKPLIVPPREPQHWPSR